MLIRWLLVVLWLFVDYSPEYDYLMCICDTEKEEDKEEEEEEIGEEEQE